MSNDRKKSMTVAELSVQRQLAPDLDMAKRLIMAGRIHTGDHVWNSPNEKISPDIILERKGGDIKYVSRGAVKLEQALNSFSVNVTGKACLDIGASTGGFTQVLLLNGAAHVTALDVGYGLIDQKLRMNPRVSVMERTNFRLLSDDYFQELFDIIVTDVSFISLKAILPKARNILKKCGDMIALIKPQFEAPADLVPTGGIVESHLLHSEIIKDLEKYMSEYGIYLHNLMPFIPKERKKNVEFPSHWRIDVPSKDKLDPGKIEY